MPLCNWNLWQSTSEAPRAGSLIECEELSARRFRFEGKKEAAGVCSECGESIRSSTILLYVLFIVVVDGVGSGWNDRSRLHFADRFYKSECFPRSAEINELSIST